MQFPFKESKHPATYFECGMCGLPANYQCEECRECLQEESAFACQQCLREEMENSSMSAVPSERKTYIGSGEDVCLSLLGA